MHEEHFNPMSVAGNELLVPDSVVQSQYGDVSPRSIPPADHELYAQQAVLGIDGHGSIRRADNHNGIEARQESTDKAIVDMLRPENILDLKAAYDRDLSRIEDEGRFTSINVLTADKDGSRAEAASNSAAALKESLIEKYTQTGGVDGLKREVPEPVKSDISRMMSMSYEELEKKANAAAAEKRSGTRGSEDLPLGERSELLRLLDEAQTAALGDSPDAAAAANAKLQERLRGALTQEERDAIGAKAREVQSAAESKENFTKFAVEAAGKARKLFDDTKEASENAAALLDVRASRNGWMGDDYNNQVTDLMRELERPIDETDDPMPEARSDELAESLKRENLESYLTGDPDRLDEVLFDEILRARYAKRGSLAAEADALANYWRAMKTDVKSDEEIDRKLAELVDNIHDGR